MLRGLAWAIEQGFQVVNMSLSTTRTKYVERLHELADHAYFKRVLLVASAHNMPVESFPWRFASVISVGSHEETDPLTFYYNPSPPVEFFARGLDLDVAWLGRRHASLHRQQLRHAAHRRHLRAHPRQAPGPDAVPAQERPLPDRVERRGGGSMSDLEAAVAAGVLGADEAHRALLQATVEVARAIFGAKAASVFLLDEDADELVFEAVAGEGEGELIGMRFPAGTGIAGWVLTTRQPLVVDDLSSDTRCSRSAAESTGYVPKSMMAVPLLVEERALGVLSVLDRPDRVEAEARRGGLARPVREPGGDRARPAAASASGARRPRRRRPPRATGTRRRAARGGREGHCVRAASRARAGCSPRRPISPRGHPPGARVMTMFSAVASVGAWPVTATRNSSLFDCEEPQRLEGAYRRRSRDVAQQRDLTEEVAGPELPGRAVVELHDGLAGGDGVEVVADLAA